MNPADSIRKAEEAQRNFRALLVRHGIVTEEQAKAVSFQPVDPADHPEVPRCPCALCRNSSSFMAFCLDEEAGLSRPQIEGIIAAYNKFCGPYQAASTDLSQWKRQ